MKTKNSAELIIVGAGIVGLTLACALAKKNFHIVLLERNSIEDHWQPDTYDLRVSAITRAAENIFRALNAWEEMIRLGVSSYRSMQVWDPKGAGSIAFHAAEIGEPNLGHIIEHRVLRSALLKELNQYENVEILVPEEIKKISSNKDTIEIECQSNRRIQAKLLVGCDGAKSTVRELVNIPVMQHSYQQHALVTTITVEHLHESTARQWFTSQGIIAFLPLNEPATCSIVWSGDSDYIQKISKMNSEELAQILEETVGKSLGKISCGDAKLTFPLQRQHAQTYLQHRLALIGDAAHTIHPLAGQGVNLGLLDAACLAEILENSKNQQKDFGELAVLRKYERWRKGHNTLMMHSMDAFKELFATEQSVWVWLRSQALNFTDHFNLLKYKFVTHAMGLEGDLPILARGQPL